MSRPVSKLIDLDIDEVSVVDRGANQHSLIAFSKSLMTEGIEVSEESMADDTLVFDEAGQEVDVDTLEHGATVFDAEGHEYVFIEDGEESDDDEIAVEEIEVDTEDEGDDEDEESEVPDEVLAKSAYTNFTRGLKAGVGGWKEPGASKAAQFAGRNRKKIAAGAAGAAALTGGALMSHETSKSLGDSVIEQLSKAVTDAERDEIVAKALNEVEILKAEAAEAKAWAEAEHDARVTEAFISKAEEYNLPVAPAVLGPILKAVAEVLSEEELDILDEIFTAVGDALYEELGYVGESSNSSVLDQVNAMASEQFGKSADFSAEQMTTAMFEANPAAYDAYLAEIGR